MAFLKVQCLGVLASLPKCHARKCWGPHLFGKLWGPQSFDSDSGPADNLAKEQRNEAFPSNGIMLRAYRGRTLRQIVGAQTWEWQWENSVTARCVQLARTIMHNSNGYLSHPNLDHAHTVAICSCSLPARMLPAWQVLVRSLYVHPWSTNTRAVPPAVHGQQHDNNDSSPRYSPCKFKVM